MGGYLRRLVTTGAAYQASDILQKLFALGLLPVYTRQLSRADYGTAELILTSIIFGSIVLRAGIGEALVRFHFLDGDAERRRRIARAATGLLLIGSTAAAALGMAFAGPLSELLLDRHEPAVMRAGVLGLWAFSNLELAYALLRVEERARTYLLASMANVLLTTVLTVVLVVGLDEGAFGLVLGNYGASAIVLLGLWWALRDRLGLRVDRATLAPMLRFGLPTVPAELSVFALFFVDRLVLYRADSPDAAGIYALAVKLAGVVIFTVRAFQLAWPPLIYSIDDDAEAARVYARITTYYVLVCGTVVAGCALLGRWLVRLLAAPKFFEAHEALTWVALGWALYGLYLVFVTIAGRAQMTVRTIPAAVAGLVVNVVVLILLVDPLGAAGAGIALVAAYATILAVVFVLTRSLLAIPFEWRRLAAAVALAAGVSVAGELALPTAGADGFALRAALLALLPVGYVLAGAITRSELRAARRLAGRLRRQRVSDADAPGPDPTATPS